MCQWPSLRGPHWLSFPGAGIAGQSISCEEDFVTEWMAQQLAVHQQYLVRAEQCGCELNVPYGPATAGLDAESSRLVLHSRI